MIETISGAIYSCIAITGLFGILLILSRDLWSTYKHHPIIDNIGPLFICLALIEVIIFLWVEVIIYFLR